MTARFLDLGSLVLASNGIDGSFIIPYWITLVDQRRFLLFSVCRLHRPESDLSPISDSFEDGGINTAISLLATLETVFRRDVRIAGLNSIVDVYGFTDINYLIVPSENVDASSFLVRCGVYMEGTERPPAVLMNRSLVRLGVPMLRHFQIDLSVLVSFQFDDIDEIKFLSEFGDIHLCDRQPVDSAKTYSFPTKL